MLMAHYQRNHARLRKKVGVLQVMLSKAVVKTDIVIGFELIRGAACH
jgi:hypothetical protein